MNVTCPNCATIYRVDPAKVPEAGVRARCAVCAAIFPVRREVDAPALTAAPATPATSPAPTAFTPPPEAPPAPPPAPAPAPPPAAAPIAPVVTAAPEPAPIVPAPAPPPPAPMQAPPRPAAPAAPRAGMPQMPPAVRPPVAPPRPAGLPPAPARPPAPPAAPASSAFSGSSGTAAGKSRPPVNPFLSQDPSQKARRLARALISDMVVYHPAKRREGLRDGNLKELFEEEIKKSWEEYGDQVGREVAESTTHFKDALNEILADGRQIF